jgi:RNA polymerase sigma-70 factor (ECF subfamily)
VNLASHELIQQILDGDESAWSQLIEEHQEAVFRLVYLILGDADDAKDVAQDAFIRAYNHFYRFDPERPLRPWLYRIASRLAYNHHRSLGRRWAALKRFRRIKPEQSEHPEALSIQQIEAQTLREAVARLKRQDQEVLYLRFFLDLSIDETAESLEIPAGTVKSRQSRALDRLKGIIQREYPSLEYRFAYE